MPRKKKSDDVQIDTKKTETRDEKSGPIDLFEDRLVINFKSRHELLPRIMEVASHIGDSHFDFLTQPGVTQNVLGGSRARIIVSNCAGSDDWQITLAEIGLDLFLFESCVDSGVTRAGYIPPPIPATGDTRLVDVVWAIQEARSNQ